MQAQSYDLSRAGVKDRASFSVQRVMSNPSPSVSEIDSRIFDRARRGDRRAFAAVVSHYDAESGATSTALNSLGLPIRSSVAVRFDGRERAPAIREARRSGPLVFQMAVGSAKPEYGRESFVGFGTAGAHVLVEVDGGIRAGGKTERDLDALPG